MREKLKKFLKSFFRFMKVTTIILITIYIIMFILWGLEWISWVMNWRLDGSDALQNKTEQKDDGSKN